MCICSAGPASWGADGLALGEFTLRAGHGGVYPMGAPANSKVTMQGMDAAHFAASFGAIATWNPLHRDAMRRIHDINPQCKIGLCLAVEAITAMLHADPILDALRDKLVPLAYVPPVDYYANAATVWPLKPHAMAVDFEHRPVEVVKAVGDFLDAYVAPLELDFVFYDVLLRRRYWGAAPNPPEDSEVYHEVWCELVKHTQSRIAPVWGHSGVGPDANQGPHVFRVEEHFYRLRTADRARAEAAAKAAGQVLVRSGEWFDISPEVEYIRGELERAAAAGDAWVVSARSGSAFGVWS